MEEERERMHWARYAMMGTFFFEGVWGNVELAELHGEGL